MSARSEEVMMLTDDRVDLEPIRDDLTETCRVVDQIDELAIRNRKRIATGVDAALSVAADMPGD